MDGRSDGQTESIVAKTALCIGSYADTLSKIIFSIKYCIVLNVLFDSSHSCDTV